MSSPSPRNMTDYEATYRDFRWERPESFNFSTDVIDRWVFSGNRPLVREVYVDGQRCVAEGRHRDHEAIARRYRQALPALVAD